ncbi:hypothetical protein ADM96_02105 [Burkholderia sp. ST111]|nr:hypothetical protein ADM96_02105 [Burkholderia sp. ST111]
MEGAVVFGRDITERKRMEELLAAHEREFRSLAENLPDIIVRFDCEGRRTYVNGAHERFTGRPPETFLGKTVLEISAFSMEQHTYHEQIRQAIETGRDSDVEWKARGSDGIQRTFHTRLRLERDANGKVLGLLAVARDMTEVYEYRSKIHQLAYFDTLTGLANRAQFNERILQELQQAGQEGSRVGVLMMDLDRFKTINDTFGHVTGDQLLCEVARRLEASVRATDTVARLGGDEFIISRRTFATPRNCAASPTAYCQPWPLRCSSRAGRSWSRRASALPSIPIMATPQNNSSAMPTRPLSRQGDRAQQRAVLYARYHGQRHRTLASRSGLAPRHRSR